MDEERAPFLTLRARVQTRMEALAGFDGEEWTPEDQRQLCCALMSLGYGSDGGPLRIRATPEETLVMEDYMVWVAAHFPAEIAKLDELTTALIQRLIAEGLDEDAVAAEVGQANKDFMEGTEDPNQLPLFP